MACFVPTPPPEHSPGWKHFGRANEVMLSERDKTWQWFYSVRADRWADDEHWTRGWDGR